MTKDILSPQDILVLSLIADGLSHIQIAERLSVEPETARSISRVAREAIGGVNNAHAVKLAYERGLLPRVEDAIEA